MSLIDDASLIQIPSGYKEDKLYSIKPTNGDGDFTFTRASSATRVNAEGLIETASVLGSELITNGDFATDSDWDKSSNTTISGGQATFAAIAADQYLIQRNLWPGSTLSGQKVSLTYTVVSNTLNAGDFRVGGVTGASAFNVSVLNSTVGTHSVLLDVRTSVGDDNAIDFSITATLGSLSIDNVSVKEVITNNVPRLDYSGGASCASLLLEPQRSNLITQSESFDNSYWIKNGASITSGFTSPDGTTNAFKLVEDTSTGVHRIYQTSTVTSSTNVSISTYVKYAGTRWVFIRNAENSVGRYFDLVDGVTGGTGGLGMPDNSLMVAMGDGWYKISVSNTNTSAARLELWMTKTEQATFSTPYVGDGTSGVYIYGAQLEAGSYPTSYIPSNSGSTTTRTADACNGAGNDQVFNDSEGVLMAEIAALADDGTNRMLSLSDGSTNNRVLIKYDNIANRLEFFVFSGGTSQYTLIELSLVSTLNNKIAFKYKENDFAVWANGFELDTNTSGSTPIGLSELAFNDGAGGNDFYGKTKQLQYFDTALTDSELETLTSFSSFNEMATALNYTII